MESDKKVKKEFKLTDQFIQQLFELLQLTLITGVNIVDNLRGIRVEESEKTPGALILSEAYVEGWNKMADDLHKKAEEKAKEMQALAQDDSDVPETEVVISRDPKTGKLVGTRSN